MSYFVVKRLFDFLFALAGLVLSAPIFLLIIIALTIANQGKPFFIQPRPGKDEKIFFLVKFKTMNDLRDKNGQLLSDDDRITRIGNFVRNYSLDELPQMINVLVGDMSLIGPRPLLVDYLPLYNSTQKRRHDLRPGITGWAQVNGRNSICWTEKFEYDVWYVDHVTFLLDMKIFLSTIRKVILSDGISAQGVKTMPRFNGNN